MILKRIYVLFTYSLMVASLGGCFGTTPNSKFYLLEPIRDSGTVRGTVTDEKILIALTPVRIPDYIDRPQIISGAGHHSYQLSEFERWAEPLNNNIARVLQQNLGLLVPAEVILSASSNRAKQAALRVSVNILEFHLDAQHQALLTANWQINRGEKTLASTHRAYKVPARHQDTTAAVDALNQCLDHFSQDLARALQSFVDATENN